MTKTSTSRLSKKPLATSNEPPQIEKMTDVIRYPKAAWEEIVKLRQLQTPPDPFKDGSDKAVVPGYPFTVCDVVAPPSKACSLGKQCKCIQAAGHTTPHRARCGSRWANRKREK